MQKNQKRPPAAPVYTHTGGTAVRDSAYLQLRRAVLNCLLWENNFHESGVDIAKRIQALVPLVPEQKVYDLAVEARNEFGLRHVPLLLAREMARGTPAQRASVAGVLPMIIKRPDEIAELLSLYWADNDGKKFITHPLRRGIAAAMQRFNEFQYAKWDRKDRQVRIRDAMFMAHVKPADVKSNTHWTAAERKAARNAKDVPADRVYTEREAIQAKIADDQLKQEGTWEDRLSAGEKADMVFSDLMQKKELGALAFIRNVRKMQESGIAPSVIEAYAPQVNLRGVFPHQLITAARVNKQYESMFDQMLIRLVSEMPKLSGSTIVLIDVSGSMDAVLSNNRARGGKFGLRHAAPSGSEVIETTRIDAAAAVAIMAREICEKVRIFTFSDSVVEVPARRGLALRDAIEKSQPHGGTYMARAIQSMNKHGYDRLIAITDEQSHDGGADPLKKKDESDVRAYMCNVAPYEHSVAQQGAWTKIEGWSPAVIRYITQIEAETSEV